MAKVFQLRAPDSMTLTDTPLEEVERYVTDMAERGLELLGDSVPIRVNAVSLAQQVDVEVWAEWSRACCGHRSRIEEFEEPVITDFEIESLPISRRLHGTHLESQLRVIKLEGPSHQKG